MRRYGFTALLAAAHFALVGPAAADTITFVGLGDLAGGTISSQARAVSGDGSVAVGDSGGLVGSTPRVLPFRWTELGGMAGLGLTPIGQTASAAYGASDNGAVIVGNIGNVAFVWTQAGGGVELTDGSTAWDVAGDGSVIVGQTGGSTQRARAWIRNPDGTYGAATSLPGIATGPSLATGVSGDGSVIVGQAALRRFAGRQPPQLPSAPSRAAS